MRILVVAATVMELEPLAAKIPSLTTGNEILFRPIGVGCLAAVFNTCSCIVQEKPDLVLLGGIAGALDTAFGLGDTYLVQSDTQVSAGVEENGEWKDLFDLGFAEKDLPPYRNGRLFNPYIEDWNTLQLPLATGISVDEISTRQARIESYRQKYGAQVESMEGAAFHYACLQLKVPFLQVRSISNYAGERDKHKWNIAAAVKGLNESMEKLINSLS